MRIDKNNKLIYPQLSYVITGVCFDVHNTLGRFAKERQYGDAIEAHIQEIGLPHKREYRTTLRGNIVDFIIDDKVLLELKAKRFIIREDYYQTQRYLQSTNLKLGLIVNFRSRYLKPIRVVRIDTDVKKRFL